MENKLKAWSIDPSMRLDFSMDKPVVYADNIEDAKINLLPFYRSYMLPNMDLVSIETIKVKRRPTLDKLLFEGEYKTPSEISVIANLREKAAKEDEILKDETITHCHVYALGKGYYETERNGYSTLDHAHIFPKEKAVKYCQGEVDIQVLPINNEKHNKRIQKKIKDLQSRLIK